MHGIFVGEIQALEGAGRTCWDFEVGSGNGEGIPEVPFELKLDMARQCWDEARHCEISIKLSDHMGTELGEFSENTFLYEAACNPDPVLRLTGVNRALEGLAIDVFNTMREFGDVAGDPVLEFCEDWMLADEVTHVKMGSDWLRQLTANDKERQERALEFQRVVDKLFSPRRLPRRGRGQPRAPGPPLPRAGRLRGRGDGHPGRDRPRGARGDGGAGRGQPRRRRQQLGASMPVEIRPDTSSRWCSSTPPRSRASSRSWSPRSACPADLSVTVEVDETTPLGRARVASIDPLLITVESGALEDVKAPRQLSARGHDRRARQAPVLRARSARPRLRRAARRRRPHACRSRWRGRSTASVGSAASGTRCSASAGSTSSATATASPTPPTPPSSGSGTAEDLTWADISPVPRPSPSDASAGGRAAAGRRAPARRRSGDARAARAQCRSWARIGSRRSIAGGPASRPAQPSAIVIMSAESKWACWSSGRSHFWMITNRFGWVGGHGQVDVAAPGVAAAEHHVAGQHGLQPLRVEGVEGHRDHRELDLVGGGLGAIVLHVLADQEIRSAGLAPLTRSVS